MPDEPKPEVKTASRISIRLANGERVVRRFAKDAEMEELYAFVECHDIPSSSESISTEQEPIGYEHEYGFRLVSPMPRTIYEVNDGGSVGVKVGRSGNLIVEPINQEGED